MPSATGKGRGGKGQAKDKKKELAASAEDIAEAVPMPTTAEDTEMENGQSAPTKELNALALKEAQKSPPKDAGKGNDESYEDASDDEDYEDDVKDKVSDSEEEETEKPEALQPKPTTIISAVASEKKEIDEEEEDGDEEKGSEFESSTAESAGESANSSLEKSFDVNAADGDDGADTDEMNVEHPQPVLPSKTAEVRTKDGKAAPAKNGRPVPAKGEEAGAAGKRGKKTQDISEEPMPKRVLRSALKGPSTSGPARPTVETKPKMAPPKAQPKGTGTAPVTKAKVATSLKLTKVPPKEKEAASKKPAAGAGKSTSAKTGKGEEPTKAVPAVPSKETGKTAAKAPAKTVTKETVEVKKGKKAPASKVAAKTATTKTMTTDEAPKGKESKTTGKAANTGKEKEGTKAPARGRVPKVDVENW